MWDALNASPGVYVGFLTRAICFLFFTLAIYLFPYLKRDTWKLPSKPGPNYVELRIGCWKFSHRPCAVIFNTTGNTLNWRGCEILRCFHLLSEHWIFLSKTEVRLGSKYKTYLSEMRSVWKWWKSCLDKTLQTHTSKNWILTL